MKNMYLLLVALLLILVPVNSALAEDGAEELKRIGKEVAALKIGFGDYFLGQQLNDQQKKTAKNNAIEKTIKGSYKFNDGEIFVIAALDTDMVIGLYKENPRASQKDVRNLIGELMMRFEEPTTMAHDKLIYWAYGKEGRISQDAFDAARQSGGNDVLATVKFSSSLPVRPSEKTAERGKEGEKKDKVAEAGEVASVYVLVTSNPLSKIFLALNK